MSLSHPHLPQNAWRQQIWMIPTAFNLSQYDVNKYGWYLLRSLYHSMTSTNMDDTYSVHFITTRLSTSVKWSVHPVRNPINPLAIKIIAERDQSKDNTCIISSTDISTIPTRPTVHTLYLFNLDSTERLIYSALNKQCTHRLHIHSHYFHTTPTWWN